MKSHIVGSLINFLYRAGVCERRSYLRIYIKLPVTIILSNNLKIAGHIHNVSAGGVFIKTFKPIPDNEKEFHLDFKLPDKSFKKPILGKLVWQKQYSRFYETGIEFTRISEVDRDLILHFNFEKHVK